MVSVKLLNARIKALTLSVRFFSAVLKLIVKVVK
ncbi:MAG: hypothetical protein ACI92O_003747 [Colwellia sp.]|jgi:hypothetical protein